MQIDYFPKRIVCLTEEPTEILYLLNEQGRIVGISGFTMRPRKARKEKPKVSAFTSANIDEILKLNPDLVIGFSDIQASIAQELILKGITVLINNYRSVDEIYEAIVRLGSMVGKSQEAIDWVHQNKAMIKKKCTTNQLRKVKPKIYFEEWYDPLIRGIQWVSELIEIAGGIDIYADKKIAPLGKERIIEHSEEVVKHNPDIIIASWCGKKFKKEKLISRNNWDTINAVKTDHIYEIKSELILQPGPAALTDGLDELVRIIEAWHMDQDYRE